MVVFWTITALILISEITNVQTTVPKNINRDFNEGPELKLKRKQISLKKRLVHEDGQDYSENTLPGVRFELQHDTLDWYEAGQSCASKGGQLATIRSKQENDLAVSLAPDEVFLIGGTEEGHLNYWTWENGDPIQTFYWSATNPSHVYYGVSENCLEIGTIYATKWNGPWNDINCTWAKKYMCEFRGEKKVAKGKSGYAATTQSGPGKQQKSENPVSKNTIATDVRYELQNDTLDWYEAGKSCAKKGGHLATIRNKQENDLVMRLASDNVFFIGGTEEGHLNHWTWEDGEPVTTANWSSGNPSHMYFGVWEHCLEISNLFATKWTGPWNDVNCSWPRKYMCEFRGEKQVPNNISYFDTTTQAGPGKEQKNYTQVTKNPSGYVTTTQLGRTDYSQVTKNPSGYTTTMQLGRTDYSQDPKKISGYASTTLSHMEAKKTTETSVQKKSQRYAPTTLMLGEVEIKKQTNDPKKISGYVSTTLSHMGANKTTETSVPQKPQSYAPKTEMLEEGEVKKQTNAPKKLSGYHTKMMPKKEEAT